MKPFPVNYQNKYHQMLESYHAVPKKIRLIPILIGSFQASSHYRSRKERLTNTFDMRVVIA
jgi:hypothetical protein